MLFVSMQIDQSEAKSAYLRAAKEAERHLQTMRLMVHGGCCSLFYQVKSGNPQ